MKTFLFTILTAILVHHTIQYANAEERQLLHTENSPEEHELDREIVRPLSIGMRSASEIKNWVKDMIAMRGRGRGKGHKRPGRPKPTRPPHKPKPTHTTKKPHDGNINISASVGITIEIPDNREEEQVLLEYTPKHKKVDVPMIIFAHLRE